MNRIGRYFLDQQSPSPSSSSHSQIPHWRCDRCHANHLHSQIRKFTHPVWCNYTEKWTLWENSKCEQVFFDVFFSHSAIASILKRAECIQKKNQRSPLRWTLRSINFQIYAKPLWENFNHEREKRFRVKRKYNSNSNTHRIRIYK